MKLAAIAARLVGLGPLLLLLPVALALHWADWHLYLSDSRVWLSNIAGRFLLAGCAELSPVVWLMYGMTMLRARR